MLTLQHLLNSRPKWNSGTAQIFWYMMDDHVHFWCHPEIAWLPWTFPRICVYHFQILGLRCYQKRQPRSDEEPRRNQHLSGMSVQSNKSEKKVFWFVRKWDIPYSASILPKNWRIRCKTMIILLSERSPMEFGHSFGSSQRNVNGFSKGSTGQVRICPKVFSPFGRISSTLFEIFFLLLAHWWLGCAHPIDAITKNYGDVPR